MRPGIASALGAGLAAATAVAIALAPSASANGTAIITHEHTRTSAPAQVLPKDGTCYQQLQDDTGESWISSKFLGAANKPFTNQGADDFTLTSTCVVTQVEADGVFSGALAPSVNVDFYADNGGVPGKAVRHGKEKKNAFTSSDGGNLDITLNTPLTLRPGTYWVSVQPISPDGSNDWLWLTNAEQAGSPAVWRNPKDGFQLGCTTYTILSQCELFGTGPDFTFAVLSD